MCRREQFQHTCGESCTIATERRHVRRGVDDDIRLVDARNQSISSSLRVDTRKAEGIIA